MGELSKGDLIGIERRISSLEQTVQQSVAGLDKNLQTVSKQLTAAQADLQKLKNDFESMINEQRRTAALQQASTELVTVRQEMERSFGNYSLTRNTMIGILQATDAALVRKVTVAQVSEELMVSTPNYWLAPVLVAIAAWIGNDQDLANRAIIEALKRDNEHTSLVMALVCRRNNRTQTCYEWLSRYFATQSSASFDEDEMVYINAYINGVFGPDEKHMCDDYITHWIDEIRGSSSNFENTQVETWQTYFNRFNVSQGEKYPALQACVQEFGYIDQYLARVAAVNGISESFHNIQNAFVDQDALRRVVDEHLIKLVSADDKAERKLREKEEYLIAVKACEGDTAAARQTVEKHKIEKATKTMNIIEHFTRIVSDGSDVHPAEKKTAVSFLQGYINRGFSRYIEEKKEVFPQQITLNVNGWSGQTVDGGNGAELQGSYESFLANQKEAEKAQIAVKMNPKRGLIGAAILGVLGVIFLITLLPIGVILLLLAGISLLSSNKTKHNRIAGLAALETKYQTLSQEGRAEIERCLAQWEAARNRAQSFEPHKPEHIVA